MEGQKLTFSRFVDWLFLAVIAFVGTKGVDKISDLSKSIEELNGKMAVVMTVNTGMDRRILDCETRVRDLEIYVWKGKR